MLHTLRIRNLAILPEAELEFKPGFTALTGETGAGKSILLGALKLVLGAKAKGDLIRQGEDKLRVEAIFDLPPAPELRALLREREIDADDELIIEREVTAAGKSRARVNGTLVPLADLEAVGRHLVDLHGQHEQQGLLDAATHGAYLDGHAGLVAEAGEYARTWRAWRDAESALQRVADEAERLREQIEFLQFQFKELDKAGLREGEEEKIEADLKMLSAFEKISGGRDAGLEALEGTSGVFPALGRLQREIQALGKHLGQEAVAPHEEKLGAARELLDEVRGGLRGLNVPAEADPEKLDALNARLALFQRLKSKYKTDVAGLVALRDRRRAEIDAVENAGVETGELRDARDAARKEALARATALSTKRKAAAKKFDSEVNARLARLGMEGSRFETRLESGSQGEAVLGSTGLDRIEFFLAANAGEPARALRLSASGGEISRVMLAVKGALAQTDPRPLLVFDELDTGIGGQTALRVGEALAELAGHHQLLVITHLHQVAARAAQQHKVEKRLEGGRTVTGVAPLSEKERAAELARMMGGESETALKHAREMLRKG
ncbi:MAG TPA: DNA repair protein RecN [Fibrobacteria bacterium]|nr:DNA repair protein RecN [Fibrobacteria bacterium]